MQYRVVVAASVFVLGCTNSNTGGGGKGDDSGVAMDAGSSPNDSGTQSDASTPQSDASTAGDCTPGTSRCSDSLHLERCDASSKWQSLGQCSGVCLNNACTGECGPGATACCTSLPDGTDVRCSSPSDVIVQACTAGTSCQEPRVVFVRTCNELGEWVHASSCPECLVAANDFVRYAMCRICPVPGVGTEARCDSTQDCLNGCGE